MNRTPISSRFPLCENDSVILKLTRRSIKDSVRSSIKHYTSYKAATHYNGVDIKRDKLNDVVVYKEFFDEAKKLVQTEMDSKEISMNNLRLKLVELASNHIDDSKQTNLNPVQLFFLYQNLVDTFFELFYNDFIPDSEDENGDENGDIMSNLSAISSASSVDSGNLKSSLKVNNNCIGNETIEQFNKFTEEIINVENESIRNFIINKYLESFLELKPVVNNNNHNNSCDSNDAKALKQLIRNDYIEKYVFDGSEQLYDDITSVINMKHNNLDSLENPKWLTQFLELFTSNINNFQPSEDHFNHLNSSMTDKTTSKLDFAAIGFSMNIEKFYYYLNLLDQTNGKRQPIINDSFHNHDDFDEVDMEEIMRQYLKQSVPTRTSSIQIKFHDAVDICYFNMTDPASTVRERHLKYSSNDD